VPVFLVDPPGYTKFYDNFKGALETTI